ncbi:MAG: hypothetical protein C0523_08920 [Cytophaga sp.]|nr:hypothetical protein [Cytophaga sp.]
MNRLNQWRWIALVIVSGSTLLQWFAHSCGLLLTHDSYNYLSAAKSFREHGQLLAITGDPYIYWPPLFPVLLSLFREPLKVMMWTHLILFVAIGSIMAIIAERLIQHKIVRGICMISLMCGVHLIMNSVFLWSELLFIFLALILSYYLPKSNELSSAFVTSLVLGFLLCIQRNAGIYILSGAALWIAIEGSLSWQQNIKKALFFFIITTSGFWLWNLSITFLFSSPFQLQKGDFFYYIGYNLKGMMWALLKTYLPLKESWTVLMVVILIGLFFFLKKNFKEDLMLRAMSCIILGYLLGIILLFRIEAEEELDRFVSVILPFSGLIFFSAIDKMLIDKSNRIKMITSLALTLWLIYPLGRTAKNVIQWHETSCSVSTVSVNQ